MTPLSARAFALFTAANPVLSTVEVARRLDVPVMEAQSALHNDLRFRRLPATVAAFDWTTNDLYFGTVPKKDRRKYNNCERNRDDHQALEPKKPTATEPAPAPEPKPPRIKKPRNDNIPSRQPGYLPSRPSRAVQWLIDHPGEHSQAEISAGSGVKYDSLYVILRHPWVQKRLTQHPTIPHNVRNLYRAQVPA